MVLEKNYFWASEKRLFNYLKLSTSFKNNILIFAILTCVLYLIYWVLFKNQKNTFLFVLVQLVSSSFYCFQHFLADVFSILLLSYVAASYQRWGYSFKYWNNIWEYSTSDNKNILTDLNKNNWVPCNLRRWMPVVKNKWVIFPAFGSTMKGHIWCR